MVRTSEELGNLLYSANNIIITESTKQSQLVELNKMLVAKEALAKDICDRLDVTERAATLIGNVSDEQIKNTLSAVAGVINKALAVLFKDERRVIAIEQTMYRNTYPHFNIVLETEKGVRRTFKQSGTGLAQVVSFLATLCIIDVKGGRKILVMDELLSGLHPDAKGIVRDIIMAMKDRFQFVVVEHNFDIGKQYVVKKVGDTASVKYCSLPYYQRYWDANNDISK